MNPINIRKIQEHELDWVNTQYQEVDFIPSSLENECIVMAVYRSEPAGIGRVVQIDENNCELGGIYVFPAYRGKKIAQHIVGYLCDTNPYPNTVMWCLPFKKLHGFYEQFGFSTAIKSPIPIKIMDKLAWCNNHKKYQQEVLLLSKKITS